MTQASGGTERGASRRSALVLGDSRSIDHATVDRLAGQGFVVAHAFTARQERTHESSSAKTAAALTIELDESRADWIQHALTQAVTALGPLDAVVINAGMLQFSPGTSLTLGDLELRLGNDVRRIYEAIQCAAPRMREGGRIVTIAAGAVEWNGATAVALSMVRATIASLVKGMALDLASRRITVNNIQSSPVDASLAAEYAPHLDGRIPLGWVGKPHEVASLVAYLATDACSAMTGASITIDGGFAL